jgi:ribose 5-phosphate isomerase A
MNRNQQKQQAAEAALEYIENGDVIGVGTGSTTNYFIDALVNVKNKLDGAVASSEASAARLHELGIPVLDLNCTGDLPLYVDGADEATRTLYLIKGGGGALTREKIVASACRRFICITDHSKMSDVLGHFPLPVEVIPMAQGLIARRLVGMGGMPTLRESVVTDNGNVILDVRNLDLTNPPQVEGELNNMAGVVENGIFACRKADILLLGTDTGVEQLQLP